MKANANDVVALARLGVQVGTYHFLNLASVIYLVLYQEPNWILKAGSSFSIEIMGKVIAESAKVKHPFCDVK